MKGVSNMSFVHRLLLPFACASLMGCCNVTTADSADSIRATFQEYRGLVAVADESNEARAYQLARTIDDALIDLAKED